MRRTNCYPVFYEQSFEIIIKMYTLLILMDLLVLMLKYPWYVKNV